MKNAFVALVVFLCIYQLLPAETAKLDTLQCGRYTRQAEAMVLVETGFLIAPTTGFVTNTSASYPESALTIPADTLTAINGKAVCFKATIDLYQQTMPGFLDNYKFSKEYYPISGVDSYIVTLASGGGTTAPSATVTVSKSKVTEAAGATASFILTLDKAPTSDIVVLFEFGGSAQGSNDYLSSNNLGSVKIKKGKKTGKVTITLRDDKQKELAEKLIFTLLVHGGYKLGKQKSATLTITDND